MVIKIKRSVIIIILTAFIVAAVFGYFYSKNYFYQLYYPTGYQEFVTKYANERGLDPNFVYAVIKTESNFKKDAVSNVGARGLMQIMDETYHWVKSKQSDTQTTYDDMFDSEHNIQYGTYLLRYLLDEFDNVETALAAYHAGRGAVNKWLKDASYSSDGITLDDIPINNTKHYVKKVMKNYDMYQKIYG